MIKIGINENAVLSKVAKNAQGTLETTWRQAVEGAKSDDPLAQFGGGLSDSAGGDRTIKIFPFDGKQQGENPVDSTEMSRRINGVRDILVAILQAYMTQDKIDEVLNPTTIFAGTGITSENFATRILMEDVHVKAYDNLTNAFIKLITPFLDKDELPMRLLLVRQSAAKAFADYRKNFIKDNPFIEPMSIPKEQSALKFTKWEIEKGRNNDAPVSAAPVDDKPAADEVDPFAQA